jgi:hypothetical protein
MATSSDAERIPNLGKVLLVGSEDERFSSAARANCEVVSVTDKTALSSSP